MGDAFLTGGGVIASGTQRTDGRLDGLLATWGLEGGEVVGGTPFLLLEFFVTTNTTEKGSIGRGGDFELDAYFVSPGTPPPRVQARTPPWGGVRAWLVAWLGLPPSATATWVTPPG